MTASKTTTTRTILILGAALLAGGCASASASAAARAAAPAQDAPRKVVYEEPGPGVVDYVMVVPENVVYLPWKMVGGAVKGASDGVSAGFDKGRMPILGVVATPVNLAAGFVTGFFEGLAMSPGVVGASDNFGRAMGGVMKRDTTVWWYD